MIQPNTVLVDLAPYRAGSKLHEFEKASEYGVPGENIFDPAQLKEWQQLFSFSKKTWFFNFATTIVNLMKHLSGILSRCHAWTNAETCFLKHPSLPH